jgi:xylulokinase
VFLGLDLGTSGVKAVVIDEAGELVAMHSVAINLSNPQPLWSEQDPKDWWAATVEVVQGLKLMLGERISQLRSIGLAGQMHGATFLDSDAQVLRPCILWNDGRSAEQCRRLEADLPDFHERSGNLAMPGFTAPKVVWVAEHEPELFARVAKILLPKDYLAFRLTGRYCSDMSDAAGTLWLNPATRDWDDALLKVSGLDRSYMPELLEGNSVAGTLTAEAAEQLGLPNLPVVIGGGDNACGAIGVGVTEPGQAFISLGTSGVLFVVSDGHCASPENTVHAFCHCLPKRWHQMSVSLSAANSLSWFAGIVNCEVPELLAELDDSGIQMTPVLFLPYLSGERTPHNDPEASGVFFGLKNSTSRAEMTLAILEAVAFSFADGYAALKAAHSPIDEITLIGGGARSERWRQIHCDVLQRALSFRDGGEVGPGLGAARLAHLAEFSALPEAEFNQKVSAVCPPPPLVQVHQPDPEKIPYYQPKLERYRALYQQTRSLNSGV